MGDIPKGPIEVVYNLSLQDDGTRLLPTEPPGNPVCRLLVFPLRKEKQWKDTHFIPIPVSSEPARTGFTNPQKILDQYLEIGARAATHGTFYFNNPPHGGSPPPPPHPPFRWQPAGPIVGSAWPTGSSIATRLARDSLKPMMPSPEHANGPFDRWSVNARFINDPNNPNQGIEYSISRDSDPGWTTNFRPTPPADGFIRMGGGMLAISDSRYVDAGGNNIVAQMAAKSLPLAAADYSDYQAKFHTLNPPRPPVFKPPRPPNPPAAYPVDHCWSTVTGATRNLVRAGIGRSSADDWYLFFVVSGRDNQLAKSAGYNIPNLVVELYNHTSLKIREAVFFDASRPSLLATLDIQGNVYTDWTVRSDSTTSAWILTDPCQILWAQVGSFSSTPPKRITKVLIDKPVGNQLHIKVALRNMHLFGETGNEVTLELKNAGSSYKEIKPLANWTTTSADQTLDFDLDVQHVKTLNGRFTLKCTSTNSKAFPIDVHELDIRLRKALCVTFVIDDSGSMNGNDPTYAALSAVRRLVHAAFGSSGTGAMVNVIRFSSTAVSLTSGMSGNKAQVLATLSRNLFTHQGDTDIQGALYRALVEFSGSACSEWDRKQVVLLTDGNDPNFRHSILTYYQQAGIPIHTIGLGPSVNTNLLTDIAHTTGGQLHFSANIGNLFEDLGELDNEVSDDQTMAVETVRSTGSNLAPQVEIIVSDHPVTATVTGENMDINRIVVISPGGTPCPVTSPTGCPGVTVIRDSGSGHVQDEDRFITIQFDGTHTQPGAWRIEVGASAAGQTNTVVVREDSPPAERFDLLVNAPVSTVLNTASGIQKFEINWLQSGEPANAGTTEATLVSGTTSQTLLVRQVALGRYEVNVDPSSLPAGNYEVRISGSSQGGKHRRAYVFKFALFEELVIDLPELPTCAVAEEAIYFETPGPASAMVSLSITNSLGQRSVTLLPIRPEQDGMVYGGILDVGPLDSRGDSKISLSVRLGSKLALSEDDSLFTVLGPRGVWVKSGSEYLAIDLSLRTHAKVAIGDGLATMDGFTGDLWLTRKIDNQLIAEQYDRTGRRHRHHALIGVDIFAIAAFASQLATLEVVESNNQRQAYVVLYRVDGTVSLRHPVVLGRPHFLAMSKIGELYFVRQQEGFAGRSELVRLRVPQDEPEVIGSFQNGVLLKELADRYAYQATATSDLIALGIPPENLGSFGNVVPDDHGFWAYQHNQSVSRYEQNKDGTFDLVAEHHNVLDRSPGIGVSRTTGVAFIGDRLSRTLTILDGAGKRKVELPAPVESVLDNRNRMSDYPPYLSHINHKQAKGRSIVLGVHVRPYHEEAQAGLQWEDKPVLFKSLDDMGQATFEPSVTTSDARYRLVTSLGDKHTAVPVTGSFDVEIIDGMGWGAHAHGAGGGIEVGTVDASLHSLEVLGTLGAHDLPSLSKGILTDSGNLWWGTAAGLMELNYAHRTMKLWQYGPINGWAVTGNTLWLLSQDTDNKHQVHRIDPHGNVDHWPLAAQGKAIASVSGSRAIIVQDTPANWMGVQIISDAGISDLYLPGGLMTAIGAVGGTNHNWIAGKDRHGKDAVIAVDSNGKLIDTSLAVLPLRTMIVSGTDSVLWGIGLQPNKRIATLFCAHTPGQPVLFLQTIGQVSQRQLAIGAHTNQSNLVLQDTRFRYFTQTIKLKSGKLEVGPANPRDQSLRLWYPF